MQTSLWLNVVALMATLAANCYVAAQGCDGQENLTASPNSLGICYKILINMTKFANAVAARKACTDDGGEIASFDSNETIRDVLSGVQQLHPSIESFWFGAHDIEVEGTWKFVDGTESGAFGFKGIEPNNYESFNGEDCAIFQRSSTSQWDFDRDDVRTLDVPCCYNHYHATPNVLCQKFANGSTFPAAGAPFDEECFGKQGECGNGERQNSGNCFKILRSNVTDAYEARRACRDAKSDVYVADTNEKFYELFMTLQQMNDDNKLADSDTVYVGLVNMGGDVKTVNSSAVTVSRMDSSVNRQCLQMKSGNSWTTPENLAAVDCSTPVTTIACSRPHTGSLPTYVTYQDLYAVIVHNDLDDCANDSCGGAPCADGLNFYNCTTVDHCASSPCDTGSTCNNQAAAYTCTCAPGTSGNTCSDPVTCLGFPSIEDAMPVNVTSTYGSSFVVACKPGLLLKDRSPNVTVTCADSGFVGYDEATHGTCLSHCVGAPQIANGVPAEGYATSVGHNMTFTCELGHRFPDNLTVFEIACLLDGNWTSDPALVPQCEIERCPELPVFPNQNMNTRNNTYNTTVIFWCDIGYRLHDNTTARSIKCKAGGVWTANLPPCLPVLCPAINLSLPPYNNTVSKNTSDHHFDTFAKCECNGGLRMEDGATYRIIKCDATGNWSETISECTGTRCYPLPYVVNATPSSLLAEYNHTTTLTCKIGHRFQPQGYGSQIMKCNPKTGGQTTGRWAPILTHCEPINCETLSVGTGANKYPPDATLSSTATLYLSVIRVRCNKGFYYDITDLTSKEQAIECLETGLWNASISAPCEPVKCPAPPNIINGTRGSYPSQPVYNTVVPYQCDSGNKFIDGNANRDLTCNEIGAWDMTDVSCRKDRCDPVATVPHATPDTTNTSWYTTVTYSCNVGYEYSAGLRQKSCTNLGTWNVTASTISTWDCGIKYCANIPPAINSSHDSTDADNDRKWNTTLTYTCDVGYKYFDNETVKSQRCNDSQVWEWTEDNNKTFPSCNIIYCPELIDIENATRSSNNTWFNSTITYKCLDGFQFPDRDRQKNVICTENETWTDFPSACEVIFCPPVPLWDALLFNDSNNEFEAVVSYSCKDGFIFDDGKNYNVTAFCNEQKVWTPPIKTCHSQDSFQNEMKNFKAEAEGAQKIGSVAIALVSVLLVAVIILDTRKLVGDVRFGMNNIKNFLK